MKIEVPKSGAKFIKIHSVVLSSMYSRFNVLGVFQDNHFFIFQLVNLIRILPTQVVGLQ